MKRSSWLQLTALCLATAAASPAHAQGETYPAGKPGRLELSAFVGYDLNSDVDMSGGSLVVEDAPSFGAALDIAVRPGSTVELLWTYSSTEARFAPYGFSYSGSEKFGVDSHYMQVGGVQELRRGGRVVPFFATTVGAVLYMAEKITFLDNASVTPDDSWAFAFTLGGGLKIALGQKLGLRLQARLQAPVFFSGTSFYAGTGGSGLAVSGGIPTFQGNFTAGLTFSP